MIYVRIKQFLVKFRSKGNGAFLPKKDLCPYYHPLIITFVAKVGFLDSLPSMNHLYKLFITYTIIINRKVDISWP